ncbi:MAG: response regulator [Geminicoccaceae bacterium]
MRFPRPKIAAEETIRTEGSNALLLEDNALISLDTGEILLGLGLGNIHTAQSLKEARDLVNSVPLDVCVLDMIVGRKTSIEFARELVDRSIPFLFATGYGDKTTLPKDLRHAPAVSKPYSRDSLIAAFRALGMELRVS